MKKLALTAASLMAAISLHAQGQVGFDNFLAPSGIMNALTGADVMREEGIVCQLYWSSTMDGVYVAAGAPAMVGDAFGSPFPGRYSGGVVTLDGLTPPGGTAFFEVRAWEASYGSTYEQAIAAGSMSGRVALRGVSDRFMSDTGNPNAIPPDPPPVLSSLIPGFSVNVPEPSVVALGIIGAGALLMLRRRNQ